MARTIAEIQAAMVTAKEAESGLSGLTSTSKTAIWNLLFYVCAVAIKVIEDLFVVVEEQVEERRLEIPSGNLKWYAAETLNYQFGDTLVFVDTFIDDDGETVELIGKALVYNPIDSSNRVVDLSAADIVNGIIIIKAAKVTSGVAEPLSVAELAGLEQYWIERRFAGTSINIVSIAPDQLKTEYLITYNPQLLSPSGESLSTPGTYPVEDAINEFLQTYQSDNFAGTMQVMRLTDAIQLATGVFNAVAQNVEAKPDGGTYVNVLNVANQTYTALAGYMIVDPLFPLNTTLTYTPQS